MDAISTLRIIAQVATPLDAVNAEGLVHRDVKPAKILVGTAYHAMTPLLLTPLPKSLKQFLHSFFTLVR